MPPEMASAGGMKSSFSWRRLTVALVLPLLGLPALADDGMWLLNAPPTAQLKERYNFTPTAAWLEHLQKSSVRFNNGGSGSFVSADGLVITNHHVASDVLHKLSSADRDLLEDGFLARDRADEIPCLDLELNVLMSIEDVTDRVNAAVSADMDAGAAADARRAVMAEIEQASLDETGLRSDVVTLYQGGQYHLYRYKRYTDVRLVFAPESAAAAFGGDPDNFNYPRYCIDVTFFRVYEDGAPAQIEHHLTWNSAGTQEGDLVFVTGHPGSTDRLITVAEMDFARDVQVPKILWWIKSREVLLNAYSKTGAEAARQAKDELLYMQNGRKVYDGEYSGLLDPALVAQKQAEEDKLRAYSAAHPELGAEGAWAEIEAAQAEIETLYFRNALVGRWNFNSTLFEKANHLLRVATEKAKPSGERLREYRDSAKVQFELALFSPEPIYPEFEYLKVKHYLEFMAMALGADDPAVVAALGGKAPAERAAELVNGTRVGDVAYRRELYAMDAAQMATVDDPMIALARALDADARAMRQQMEALDEIKQQAHARIAKVRYALQGDSVSPDATFTLRLSIGTVKPVLNDGEMVPAYTKFDGLYKRAELHDQVFPFRLPENWLEARDRVDGDTPYNFISTIYSIGGNSGSPVVNRNAEFVGILFDGNIHSLIWNYAYTDTLARSVNVDVRGILEVLRGIYGADELLAEINAQ